MDDPWYYKAYVWARPYTWQGYTKQYKAVIQNYGKIIVIYGIK